MKYETWTQKVLMDYQNAHFYDKPDFENVNLALQAQFESLAVIREDYRKNSLKSVANHSPGSVQSDEEEDIGL